MEILNSDQKRALELALDGSNFFLTGSGGTGKSFVISYIHDCLLKAGKKVKITATTGIASIAIGGTTIHSFSGIGIGTEPRDQLRKIANTKKMREIWEPIDTLIIDEISMLKPDYFEKLSVVAQIARQNTSPFGGVQLILVGDFFQLPPVNRKHANEDKKEKDFCFESQLWNESIKEIVELKDVFRQKDPSFVRCLQRIRWGKPTDEDIRMLMSRLNAIVGNDLIRPTLLHSRTDQVNKINEEHLNMIIDEPHNYHTVDGFHNHTGTSGDNLPPRVRINKSINDLRQQVLADETLVLKKGAQVMLLANISHEHGLVNGSRGVVVDFITTNNGPVYPVVRFSNVEVIIRPYMWKFIFGKDMYSYVAQIPLKLAYAFTIHKSQSQSMDCVQIHLDSSVFAEGQAYTALSRVRMLSGLTLSAFNPQCIKANQKVVDFYNNIGNFFSIRGLMSRVTLAKMDNMKQSETNNDEDDDSDESIKSGECEEDSEKQSEDEEDGDITSMIVD